GREVDARTDIFSLGVLIFEMVTQRLPFEGSNKTEILASILSEKATPPLARYSREAPDELERIVQKALAKEREQRYQSAKDLLIDLRQLRKRLEVDAELERTLADRSIVPNTDTLSHAPQTAQGTSIISQTRPTSSAEYIVSQVKGHKRGALMLATVIVVVLAIGSFLYFKSTRTPALTEKDTIVLADFMNTTGDAVFDGTLKQGLAVQLEQSPFLN